MRCLSTPQRPQGWCLPGVRWPSPPRKGRDWQLPWGNPPGFLEVPGQFPRLSCGSQFLWRSLCSLPHATQPCAPGRQRNREKTAVRARGPGGLSRGSGLRWLVRLGGAGTCGGPCGGLILHNHLFRSWLTPARAAWKKFVGWPLGLKSHLGETWIKRLPPRGPCLQLLGLVVSALYYGNPGSNPWHQIASWTPPRVTPPSPTRFCPQTPTENMLVHIAIVSSHAFHVRTSWI